MTIVFEERGDLLSSGCQTLVCPVNLVGVMGAGLALAFKLRYPGLFPAYKKACFDGTFHRKGFFLFKVSEEKKILCLPTKRHWKNRSDLPLIDRGLAFIARDWSKNQIYSLALPPIGCGLGGLNYWQDVRGLIVEHLDPINLEVCVFLTGKEENDEQAYKPAPSKWGDFD